MVRPKSKFRAALSQVRLNLAYVVTLLVAISVLTLGLLLINENKFLPFSEQQINQIVYEEYPELRTFSEQSPEARREVAGVVRVVRRDLQQNTQRTLLIYTPLVVAASAVVSYAVARELVKPVQQSYSTQQRFIQDAAHELRNPLAAMKVSIQSIQAKKEITSDDAKRVVATMDRQVRRLIEINENLLFLDSSLEIKPQTVNLSELLEDIIEDLHHAAHKKNLEIKKNIESDIEHEMQPGDFVRLVRNILENAIKYSEEDSKEIRVGLRRKGSRVRLSIRDFGIGIPESDQHKIGSRFYRASNTSAYPGTGLGLAIVQKVANAYGGTVTINTRQGEGTHVVVNL